MVFTVIYAINKVQVCHLVIRGCTEKGNVLYIRCSSAWSNDLHLCLMKALFQVRYIQFPVNDAIRRWNIFLSKDLSVHKKQASQVFHIICLWNLQERLGNERHRSIAF